MSVSSTKPGRPSSDGGHLVVVAVPDHAGLGRPGRARGVDVGEEVLLADLGHRAVECVRVLGRVGASARLELGQVREREDVTKARQAGADRLDLRALLVVLDEHADRLRVVEHVGSSRAASCSRRSAPRRRRSGRARSRTGTTPGWSRRGSRRRRPFRHRARAAHSRWRRPASPPRRPKPAPSPRLALRGTPCASGFRADAFRHRAPIVRVIRAELTRREWSLRLEFSCPMRTTWNGSISFSLVTIPVGLAPATKPSARASDISFRQLHDECKTPIKNRRWCPVHEREVDAATRSSAAGRWRRASS